MSPVAVKPKTLESHLSSVSMSLFARTIVNKLAGQWTNDLQYGTTVRTTLWVKPDHQWRSISFHNLD